MNYQGKGRIKPGHDVDRRATRDHMRSFGQNFLKSEAVARRIAGSLGPLEQCHVLELGAGPGGLTRHVVQRAARATLIELDRSLAVALREKYQEDPRINVVEGDILRQDFETWAESSTPLKPVIAGNIPYNITNPLLFKLIDAHQGLGIVVLMLQEEVARKLSAAPGGKPYGMITVLVSYYAGVEYLFSVGRGNFSPRPNVDSAVVRLEFGRGNSSRAKDEGLFRALVKRLFLERRKQVQKVLRSDPLYRLDSAALKKIEDSTGLDLQARPENLRVEDFVMLADSLINLRPETDRTVV